MIEELHQKSQQPIKESRIKRKEEYTPFLPIPEKVEKEPLGLTITEEKILKLLLQDPSYGVEGATGIAKTLGLAREHIARTMKKMVEKGLIIRDETKMPFTYKIPDEIKRKLLTTQQ
jgi:DNA-binding MarR family transcriptional regulator